MSYVSVIGFVKAGRCSLESKNYFSALSVALMLPSMCSRIKYAGNSDYCSINKSGKLRWKDRKSYIDFCNDVFVSDGWLLSCFSKDIGDSLYNLRCDIVHAGCANIFDGDYAVWLSYGQIRSDLVEFSKYKIVSIECLCNSIFSLVENWVIKSGAGNCKKTFVFGDGKDDVLLYRRLCDEDRASVLEAKFFKELADRS